MDPDTTPRRLLTRWGPHAVGLSLLLIAILFVAIAATTLTPLLNVPSLPPATPTPAPTASAGITILPPLPSAATTEVQVPASACQVDSVLGEITPAPALINARIPADLGGQMSAYWMGRGVVMGPAGWKCQATIAQDGSWQGRISAPSGTGELRFLVFPGAPVMDMADLACPLFDAAAATMAGSGQDCSVGRPPAAELDTWIVDPTSVRFEDQPGVFGTGDGSGGALRAIGALVYAPGSVSAQLTCLLPETGGQLCDAAAVDFASRLAP